MHTINKSQSTKDSVGHLGMCFRVCAMPFCSATARLLHVRTTALSILVETSMATETK